MRSAIVFTGRLCSPFGCSSRAGYEAVVRVRERARSVDVFEEVCCGLVACWPLSEPSLLLLSGQGSARMASLSRVNKLATGCVLCPKCASLATQQQQA
jgi:hypothetical protein